MSFIILYHLFVNDLILLSILFVTESLNPCYFIDHFNSWGYQGPLLILLVLFESWSMLGMYIVIGSGLGIGEGISHTCFALYFV